MVRASKTSTPATATAAAPAPEVKKSASKVASTSAAPVAPVAPVSQDSAPVAASKPRAKKAAAPATEPVAVDASAAPDATLSNELSQDIGSSLAVKMTDFSAKLQLLTSIVSTLKNDFKTLEKNAARDMKTAKKASSKKRKLNANRKPSGFIKPTRISDELAEFLGKTVGTEMARTEVSREINTYIQSNGLQDKANGRKINPDSKLTKLLKINGTDELTYFNLQRYMKHHFIKAEVLVPVVV